MTATSFLHWAEPLAKPAAMAAAYYVIGRLGLLLAIPPGYATAVWPASGVALAGTLLFGYRVWPGILLGSFLINLRTSLDTTSTASILTTTALAASIGMGASLQAIAGASLIRRLTQYPTAFVEARDIIKFLILGGPVSCLVNATWGVTSLLLSGVIQAVDYLFHWWTWWVGDAIGVITFTPLILIWAAKPAVFSQGRQVSLPLCLAFTLVVIFFIYTNAWEQDRIRLEFKRRTDHLAQQLEENFDNYIDVLHSVGNLYASSVSVNRQQFKTFVSRWFSRHPGIRAVSWSPRVLDSERANYEQAAREDGLSNFEITEKSPQGQLVRAAQRAEYIPVYYLESVRGNKRSLGFDAASDPTRREALNRARDTGQPTATDPLTLIQDIEREGGFVVFLPIYKPGRPQNSPQERRLNLQGYVSGAFRIRDMMTTALKGAKTEDIEIRLYDARGGEKKRLLYEHRSKQLESRDLPVEANEGFSARRSRDSFPSRQLDISG
jgi:CHASE1-domain containing sensor protein